MTRTAFNHFNELWFQGLPCHEKSMDEEKSFPEHVAQRCACRDRSCTRASRIGRETGGSQFLDCGVDIAETT
jgi:hypothetical protein